MKNVTDTELKKTIAESIGLDGEGQRELLDAIHVVTADDNSITLETADRSTFERIVSGAFWPGERQSIAASLKKHVESDPQHTETSDKWFQRGTTMILNNKRRIPVPNHAETHEDWLGKGTTLVPEERLTSVPSHARTHEDWLGKGTTLIQVDPLPSASSHANTHDDWLRHTRSSIILNGRLTSVPSHTDTSEKWLTHASSIVLTPPSINAAFMDAQVRESRDAEPGMVFSDSDSAETEQRNAWLPISEGEVDETGDVELQAVLTSLPPPPHHKFQRGRQTIIAALSALAVLLVALIAVLIVMKRSEAGQIDSPIVSTVMIQPSPNPETIIAPVNGRVVSEVKPHPEQETTVTATVAPKVNDQATPKIDHTKHKESPEKKDKNQSAVPDNMAAIHNVMKEIEPSIQRCRLGQGGKLRIRFNVTQSGKVRSAETVDDVFSETTTGYCASSAAKSITLPPSEKGDYTIYHTFEL
ncbi:MAG: hypothetical protein JXX14_20480 [Deltaproteobacteria bacterium]|nr:hypothetical protein [Deltaproteobacteria bacterium]